LFDSQDRKTHTNETFRFADIEKTNKINRTTVMFAEDGTKTRIERISYEYGEKESGLRHSMKLMLPLMEILNHQN
jgi:hypothetical protein